MTGGGGPYGEDLAFIHDDGFGRVANAAAGVLTEELRRGGVTAGLVVDLGCGTGILAGRVAAAGFDVLGIDLSPSAVAIARRRVPGGTFREESLLRAALPPCVAVTATGECVNYLFDASNDDEAVRALIRRVADALAPGGVFLFDAAARGRLPEPGRRQVHAEGPGWAVIVDEEEDDARRTLTRRLTTFREEEPGRYRRGEETHRLRLLPRGRVEAWLRDAGFETRTADGYGELRLPDGVVTYRARKAGG